MARQTRKNLDIICGPECHAGWSLPLSFGDDGVGMMTLHLLESGEIAMSLSSTTSSVIADSLSMPDENGDISGAATAFVPMQPEQFVDIATDIFEATRELKNVLVARRESER